MDFIHIRTMQIEFAQVASGFLGKFLAQNQHLRDVCRTHIPRWARVYPNNARGSTPNRCYFPASSQSDLLLICSGTQLMVLFNSTSRSR